LSFEDIDNVKCYFGNSQLVQLEHEFFFFLNDYEIQLDFEVVDDHSGVQNCK